MPASNEALTMWRFDADMPRVPRGPDEEQQPFDDLSTVGPEGVEDEEPSLVSHAVTAATSNDPEERAWALVALAVDLTGIEEYEEGLRVLRAAVRLRASERSRVAALACAATIRCRQGEYGDAVRIAELVLSSTGEVDLLDFLGRVLATHAEESGDERLRDASERVLRWAAFEAAYAA